MAENLCAKKGKANVRLLKLRPNLLFTAANLGLYSCHKCLIHKRRDFFNRCENIFFLGSILQSGKSAAVKRKVVPILNQEGRKVVHTYADCGVSRVNLDNGSPFSS